MSVDSLLRDAQYAHRRGNFLEAEKAYLKLLDIGFKPEMVLRTLANVSIEANAPDRTIVYLSKLSASSPRNLAYCDALAEIFSRSNDHASAAACYQRFLETNPDHADARFNFAYHLKHAADYQAALDQYQRSLDLNVSRPEEVMTNMAVILSEHLRREHEAAELLKGALLIAPTYTVAIFNLATLYDEEGRTEDALALYEKLLEIDAKDSRALVRIADMQQDNEVRKRQLIQQLEGALTTSTLDDDSRIDLHFALAKSFDDCLEYSKAFTHYVKGNKLDGKHRYSPKIVEEQISANIHFFNEHWFASSPHTSDHSPVFICGMFRSGSTLLEQVLASHSLVTAGGERDFFVRLVDAKYTTYPNELAQLDAHTYEKIAHDYLSELSSSFPDAQLVTDKRPDNFLYLGLIKTLFPKAKIINTQRNKMDNCLSVYFLRADATIDYANDLAHTAHFYDQQQRLMAHWQKHFGDDIHTVSYDDLVVDPEAEIRAVLAFLELEWEPDCLNFHSLNNRIKTASVWQARKPLYQKSSGRWKNYEALIGSQFGTKLVQQLSTMHP